MGHPHKFIIFALFSFLLLAFALEVSAGEEQKGKLFNLDIEGGPVWQSKNDVRIPGNSGSEFSFKNLTGTGPYAAGRFTFDWDFGERHGLRLVAAPFRVEGTGTFSRPVSFAGETFASSIPTRGKYKFDTYRLGYRYQLYNKNAWTWKVGATLLVRDADIQLIQNGKEASKSNVGVVPLLHLAGQWSFAKDWQALLEFAGLAGGPGRALDLALKIQYDLSDRWQISAGYRSLEGGVDTDEVYNFSWFHYAFFSAGYRF
ncbi:MAG: hypothetical protein AB1585_05470 [Thermodesulfobacteriota bacterium]